MSQIFEDLLRPIGIDGTHEFGALDWGYLQTLYVGDKAELASSAPAPFRAMVRLRATNNSPRTIAPANASPNNLLDGDSNYAVPEDKRITRLNDGSGRDIAMTVHLNEYGRAAAFEFAPFTVNGLAAAVREVHALLERLALLYPTTTGVPLLWDTLVCERVSEPLLRALTITVPYPVVTLNACFEFGGRSLGIVDYLEPHLFEGLRS